MHVPAERSASGKGPKEMSEPILACSLVSLAIREREEDLADGRRKTELEGGEEEPRNDDDISELGEDVEAVLVREGTDSVAHVLPQLRDHDGRRQGRGVSHYLMFWANKTYI